MKVGDWILINDGLEFDLCWKQISSRLIDPSYVDDVDVWVWDGGNPQGYPVYDSEIVELCVIS
jgi:hypothetical protein